MKFEPASWKRTPDYFACFHAPAIGRAKIRMGDGGKTSAEETAYRESLPGAARLRRITTRFPELQSCP